jgi:hypothetical protein
VLEDVVPVYNIKAILNVSQKVRKISMVPQGKNISIRQTESGISFTLPGLMGHQIIEAAY